MRREAVSFTRCREAGGQKRDHRPPPRRVPVDMDVLDVLNGTAVNVREKSHKRKFFI